MSLFTRASDALIARVTRRAPDFIIGGEANAYLRRWWVIPRNRWFNIYLHNIVRSDDDRALHDHPWVNASILLRGGYLEIVPTKGATTRGRVRDPGSIVLRLPTTAHRLVILPDRGPCWSLFVTGPNIRSWGFWCPNGWVDWKDFTAGPRGELVGRGCGEL